MPKKKNKGQSFQSRPSNRPEEESTTRGAEGGIPTSSQLHQQSQQPQRQHSQQYGDQQSFPQSRQEQRPISQQFQQQGDQQGQRRPQQQGQWQSSQQYQQPQGQSQSSQEYQQFQQGQRRPQQQGQWQSSQQYQQSQGQSQSSQEYQQFQQGQRRPQQLGQGQSSQQPQGQSQLSQEYQQFQQGQRKPQQQGQWPSSQQEQRPPQQQGQRPPQQQEQRQPQQGQRPPQQQEQRQPQQQGQRQPQQQGQRPPQQQEQRQPQQQEQRPPQQQGQRPTQQEQRPPQQQEQRPPQQQEQRPPQQQGQRPPQQGKISPQQQGQLPSTQQTEHHIPRGAEGGYSPISEEYDKQIDSITEKLESLTTSKDESISESKSASAAIPSETKTSPKKPILVKLDIKIDQTMQMKFLPPRPDDGGKKGHSIQLIINCCNVKINPVKVFMYDIELTKAEVVDMKTNKKREVTPKMKKKDVLRQVIKSLLDGKEGLPVFDGGRIIFNTKLINFGEENNKITFKYTYENEPVTCHFTVQRVKEEAIKLDDLNYYITSKKGRSDAMPQEALRALDTIMREMFLSKALINIGGRAIFDPKTTKPLRCGPYVLMEGYATTIRPHMWNVRFNFDKTQVVCHESINLIDYIGKIYDLNSLERNVNQLTRKLKTLRVQADHLKNAEGKSYSRKYTIFGFSKKNAKQEMISEKNINIEQYFMQEYKIKLRYPNLLMIKTHPKNPTYVPIELLTMLPHQKVLDTDGKIVQEVIRYAAIPCFERLQTLKTAINNLGIGNKADKYLRNYMIEIDPQLIKWEGRVLDGPEAFFGGDRKEVLRSGKWDIRNKKFLKPYDKLVNWALFGVGTQRDYQRNEKPLFDVEETFGEAAQRVGIRMAACYHFEYVHYKDIEDVATRIIKDSEKEKKRLDLLVFVVNHDDDYRAVKRFGDMCFGIATQCMKYSNLSKQRNLDQYLGNIMLKVNGKLGGINWELSPIRNNNFAPIKDSFMVFGIDVTHPASTRNDLSKSIAAMVGSLDHNATLYSAIIRQQISKKEKAIVEIVMEMESMVHHLLLKFYQANKQLKPRHLLFYRDGVSEGQFEIVFKHEIIAIQNACQKLEKNYQPPITYIVVQKRHKIRFFPSNKRDEIGKSGNVPSGTVVDKDITHCREFDFYLCSHEGIQGTSKPAHYHVLFDENNWGSDDLQTFTYFLCHVYARCTRSVSYPAPTYYAHLAAFRGRTLIGQTDDDTSSVASGHSSKTDSTDSQILINEFHNDKLFFI